MTIKISPTAPTLTFKSAVMFRKAFVDGGLFATMMPGVFSTNAALEDGLQTHEALSPTHHVYLPVDVALDDKGEPISVTPISHDRTAPELLAALESIAGLPCFQWSGHPDNAGNAANLKAAITIARQALAAAEGRS